MKVLIISLLLSLLAITSAFCPNLCNGHGKCGTQDRCACYTYAGTSRGDIQNQYEVADQYAAWTGADCSLRTCPLSFSWSGATPNGLSLQLPIATNVNYPGLGSASNNVFTVTYSGSVSSNTVSAAFSSYTNFASGQKVRLYSTATGGHTALYTIRSASMSGSVITVYTVEPILNTDSGATYNFIAGDFAAFEPLEIDSSTITYSTLTGDYGQWDANGAHGLLECAGQGICDRSVGQCNCFPGYEGEACTRSSCPNSCSGHGVCLQSHRLAQDFGNIYTKAWDANKNYGCKCDPGFRGPDCSLQECPSDYDPLSGCGGGACNTGGYYKDKTNTWQACPNAAVYSKTVNNVVHNIDTSDCVTGEQRDCSGRGLCDYTSGTCNCFSGFFGESCNIQTVLV